LETLTTTYQVTTKPNAFSPNTTPAAWRGASLMTSALYRDG